MLGELFGAAGVIAGSSWGLLRNRYAMLMVQGLGTAFFGLHYLVLGAHSGAAMCLTTLMQNATAIPRERTPLLKVLFWLTVPVMAALTALTWNGLASAGAALGLSMATLGRWQTDVVRLRVFFIFCAFGWALHNITVGSPFGLASDTMTLTTNLWRLWQLRAKPLSASAAPVPAAPAPAAG
ncbi:YgjV family protein [Arenibaculum pallidiluteum]|uniref:YgjV family protein n=1 Tax=Arenibaculum pallidiluteum TaxID=2812559 RepID=UPI001A971F71|nr:YgjV family protein [Arenibaculum pallidiluteum]